MSAGISLIRAVRPQAMLLLEAAGRLMPIKVQLFAPLPLVSWVETPLGANLPGN